MPEGSRYVGCWGGGGAAAGGSARSSGSKPGLRWSFVITAPNTSNVVSNNNASVIEHRPHTTAATNVRISFTS
jgi:hypothetical protein